MNQQQAEEDRRRAMPDWLLVLQNVMDTMPHYAGGGIGGITYPSLQAQMSGMGDKYLAISGDGLFEFAFEVINPDCFRFQSPWLGSEAPWSVKFRELTGYKPDDLLTHAQLKEGLVQLVGFYSARLQASLSPRRV